MTTTTVCPYDGQKVTETEDVDGWPVLQPCGHPAPPAPVQTYRELIGLLHLLDR
jgi:hypothetical protein